MTSPISPAADYETKARHLRALYRQLNPELREHAQGKFAVDQAQQTDQWRVVKAEYERLFPKHEIRLDLILQTVWTEERELAGQHYDFGMQAWIGPDGKPLLR